MSEDFVDFDEYHKKANRGSHNGWTIRFDSGVERETSIGFFAWYAAELDDEATVVANVHDDEAAYVGSPRVGRAGGD
jgi:hypothetical protein